MKTLFGPSSTEVETIPGAAVVLNVSPAYNHTTDQIFTILNGYRADLRCCCDVRSSPQGRDSSFQLHFNS